MFIDERIASMDRLRRENIKAKLNNENQNDTDKKPLTIEEAIAGIQEGKLQLEGVPLIEFDSYIMPVQNVPFIIFKNFYDAKEENEEGVILLKREREISQIISWPKQSVPTTTFEQWGNLLVNGMASNRLYAEIKKKKQLKHIEYICFEVPSGKGPVYNILFRFREKKCPALGNYNCMSSDKDTIGIIFEAMVAALDQWADASTWEEQDGENREGRESR